jgi:hypothetical protein
MAANHVAAGIELPNLRGVEKSTQPDDVGRDEAVAAPPERLEAIREHRVIGHTAIVHGDQEGIGSMRGEPFAGVPAAHACHQVRDERRGATPHAGETRQLRVEVGRRQLVAIRGGRREPAFAGVGHVDVMEQQRYGLHGGSGGYGGRPTSSGSSP